jgi:hypothetical protein
MTSLRRPARFLAVSVLMAGLALPVMAATSVTYSGSVATQNFGTVDIGSSSNVSLSFNACGGRKRQLAARRASNGGER